MPKFVSGRGEKTPWERWLMTLDKRSWGKGQRHWSRAAALRRAVTLGLTQTEIIDELLQRCAAIGDPLREAKIRDDIENYFAKEEHCNAQSGDTQPLAAPSTPKVEVKVDKDLFRSITCKPVTINELRAMSPYLLFDAADDDGDDGDSALGEDVIDHLFPGNPWICLGYNQQRGVTERREDLRGRLRHFSLIMPQPATAAKGLTQAGKMSWHSKNNCGPWTYLIVEWDEPTTLGEQGALILHLARKFGNLVLVVFSGCNSLHAWFAVKEWSDDRREELIAYAQRIGACPASLKNRSCSCGCQAVCGTCRKQETEHGRSFTISTRRRFNERQTPATPSLP